MARSLALALPRERKAISRKLAPVNDRFRSERSVRGLADEILEPLNQGRQVNGPMTLQQYAETVYFPNIKPKKSPDLYLDKLNKHSLTRSLVHRLERLGYTVTLQQKAA